MIDGCLSNLTITESSNRATQYKEIVVALSVNCADKGYWCVDDIIHKDTELKEADFKEPHPNIALWSKKYMSRSRLLIKTVDPAAVPAADGSRTPIKQMVEKNNVFNANIQMKLVAEYE